LACACSEACAHQCDSVAGSVGVGAWTSSSCHSEACSSNRGPAKRPSALVLARLATGSVAWRRARRHASRPPAVCRQHAVARVAAAWSTVGATSCRTRASVGVGARRQRKRLRATRSHAQRTALWVRGTAPPGNLGRRPWGTQWAGDTPVQWCCKGLAKHAATPLPAFAAHGKCSRHRPSEVTRPPPNMAWSNRPTVCPASRWCLPRSSPEASMFAATVPRGLPVHGLGKVVSLQVCYPKPLYACRLSLRRVHPIAIRPVHIRRK
jgi:hypothetical protein